MLSPRHNGSVVPPPVTTTTAAAHSPPEKAKPKACSSLEALFSSTVGYRGKPGLSRSYQLGEPLSTVQREYTTVLHSTESLLLHLAQRHNKGAHSTDVVMCLLSPCRRNTNGLTRMSLPCIILGQLRAEVWNMAHVITQTSPTHSQPSSQHWARSAHLN